MKNISIVIPVYNEAPTLAALVTRLRQVLREQPFRYEIIFVDDGSDDGTSQLLRALHDADSNIKALRLTRNFGHQAALLAGIRHAGGDAVITLDGDLQHPPEVIPTLLDEWQKGAPVVNTQRIDALDTRLFKRLSSRLFYRLFNRLSGLAVQPGMADFRLLDRSVIATLQSADDNGLFMRGALQWSGVRQVVVPYHAAARKQGRSKYTIAKMINLAISGITAYSIKPLRMATLLGFFFSIVSFAYLGFAVWSWFFSGRNITGWTSLIGSVLFLGGVQLICLGIIGEYVGRIFTEVKKRPSYIIEGQIGFDAENRPDDRRHSVFRRRADIA